jgi:hypothetical protein
MSIYMPEWTATELVPSGEHLGCGEAKAAGQQPAPREAEAQRPGPQVCCSASIQTACVLHIHRREPQTTAGGGE